MEDNRRSRQIDDLPFKLKREGGFSKITLISDICNSTGKKLHPVTCIQNHLFFEWLLPVGDDLCGT
jgi:hypothetical protein